MQTGVATSLGLSESLHSLSRPVSTLTLLKAAVIQRLRLATRYIPDFVGNIIEMGIRIGFFFFVAAPFANLASFRGSNLSGETMTSENLFLFYLGALLLVTFNWPILWGPIEAIIEDLQNGTLEYIYGSPGSRYTYYVGAVIAKLIVCCVMFVPFYIILAMYSQARFVNMALVLGVSLMMGITLTGMGIILVLLGLLWKQVGAILPVLALLFEIVAGAYFPLTAFPRVIQYAAYFLPYTWGYDLVRYYSFEGKWTPLIPVWQEWGLLTIYAVIYTVVSRYLLKKAEYRAKQVGLHIL